MIQQVKRFTVWFSEKLYVWVAVPLVVVLIVLEFTR